MLKQRSVAGLLPGMIVFVGAMSAASAAYAEPSAATAPLPRGVMRKADGRYTVKMCNDDARRTCFGRWLLPPEWKPGMELPHGRAPLAAGSPMSPADIQAAYKIPAASAAHGKIVAILDSPDKGAFADLTGYRSHYKLPALPRCSGMPTGADPPCFAQINEDGKPSTGADPDPNADGETALDMDMISATCPDCSILLVEIQNLCEDDFTQGVATASKLGASAISISIGGPEATDPNAATIDAGPPSADAGPPQCPSELTWTNDQPGPYSSPGHLVFAASGDFAYNNVNIGFTATIGGASPSYPSSSPFVISVGGTTLFSNGSGGGYGEGVWNDGSFGLVQQGDQSTGIYQDITTSGCSTEFAMPPWQASVLAGTGCSRRATADLSAAAAFVSGGQSAGIAVYQGGRLGGAEGTSASSPLMAALFTRLGLTTEASNDLSWIYSNASAFNDVGSNGYPLPSGAELSDAPSGSSCGKLCTAGTGWDGPTGVGSPNGALLAALPVSTTGPVPYPDAGVPHQGDGGIDDTLDASVGAVDGSFNEGDATLGSDASGSGGGNGDSGNGSSGGCAFAPTGTSSSFGWLGTALGLGLVVARRRRSARA